MDARSTLLHAFDDAWDHAWESLTAAIEGLSDEEATWQAPCYAEEATEEGWPSPGTVAWQLAHLTHCKRYYTTILRTPGATQRPPPPAFASAPGVAAARNALVVAHTAQREALAALSEGDLAAQAGNGMPMHEFVRMMTRHDTWHAAQIAVARRLWRTR